jgi:ketosteroid isomerase-like protein
VGRVRLLILSAFFACASAPRGASLDDRRSIAAALDDFHEAAAHADEARYFAHFAPDAVFLGTDATERWDVAAFRAFAHPYFARGKAWTFRPTRRAVVVRGETAWFDEDLATDSLGPARGSGVLVFRDGRWLLEQYVLSITVPNGRLGDVRALLGGR